MTFIHGSLTNGRPTYFKHVLYLQVAQITNVTFKEALFLLHQSLVQENIAYDLHVNEVFVHWTVVLQRKTDD